LLKHQILILLISLCPSFIFIPILIIWKKHQLNKGKAPFTDNFLRSPGESLFNQIQDLNEKISDSFLEVILFPIIIALVLLVCSTSSMFNQTYTTILISAFVIFLIYYIWKILKHIGKRQLLRLGYDGEIASGQELNQLMLDGFHVYHDFRADKFNIDHIVVGPDAVYAVETKTRSKPRAKSNENNYKVISDGRTLQFPSYTGSEFLDQAERQAKWLQGWLIKAVGDPVTVKPIVLLPGWYVERKKLDGVPALNPKMVRQFLAQKQNIISQSLRTRIVHQLDQKCRDIEPKTVQMNNQ
jgi:hypothetical protein